MMSEVTALPPDKTQVDTFSVASDKMFAVYSHKITT